MSSTNPTLINGFEDVMVHIRKLEEENKKLKEENENLEERCESIALERDGALDDIDKLKEEIFLTKMKLASANENADVARHNEEAGIILAENDELKEENMKLKEENKKLKEDIEGDGWLRQGYKTDLSNSHKQQNRMVKEIVKLKEERDFFELEFHKTLQAQADDTEHYEKENKKLQDSLNKAYLSIESDVEVCEFIDHLGGINTTKEDIDSYTENQSARETLYQLANIELPEEDED